MAEGLFKAKVKAKGLSDAFVVDSAGTSAYHVGEHPDPGSIEVARRAGVDISRDRSRKVRRSDFEEFDYVIAMDRSNQRALQNLGPEHEHKIHLLRSFEPDADFLDVPDPWGGGIAGFERMYQIVDRALDGFLEHLLANESV